MRLIVSFGLITAVLLLTFACEKNVRDQSDEPIAFYIEKITGKAPSKTETYILVSDYGCSSCKEEIYQKAESESSDTVFIITSPRNTAILMERFGEVIAKGNIYIDSLKYSNALDIVYSKPMMLAWQDKSWKIQGYEEGS
jgi:hypothetical protein